MDKKHGLLPPAKAKGPFGKAPAVGRGWMGSRGILFSLMVMLLLLSVLALNSAVQKRGVSTDSAANESSAFRKVSDKYSNLLNNLARLTMNKAEKAVDQRILPFTYDIDTNTITVRADLPTLQSKVDSYLAVLNSYRVFVEDSNYLGEFDSLKSDVNLPTPPTWGGTDRNASFIVKPHCMKYTIGESNSMVFEFTCAGYTYSTMRRQDLNITLSSAHDFNSLSCSFNGSSSCFNNDFNAQNPLPYVSINLLDANCVKCVLGQKLVRGHFDTSFTSRVTVSCVGASCTTPSLDMNFMGRTTYRFSGQKVGLAVSVDLNSQIEDFLFNDINVLVENPSFGARRWTS